MGVMQKLQISCPSSATLEANTPRGPETAAAAYETREKVDPMRSERTLQSKAQLEAEKVLDSRYKTVGIQSVAAAAQYCNGKTATK